MDDTSRRVDADDLDRRTRKIRNEIEETRGELSETVDAIQERLKPRNLAASAAERVKTATTERVRDMADTASETAQQAMEYTREATNAAVDTARQNPIPLALLIAGAGWWLANRSRKSSSARYRGQPYYEYEGYDEGTARGLTDRASEAVARTREYASDTADSVRRIARRRQNQLQRIMNENPVLVGGAALLLGAAVGLAVPETEKENELMGEARDNVVERARDVARDAANEVQDAATTVADAAKKLVGKSQS
jgi:ElaB/YqjD/DUF883 family membrane-anchored ribosome-binding protein